MSEITLLSSLPEPTAERVGATLDRLLPHMQDRSAVVGGLAIRYHVAMAGHEFPNRPLHDIDLVGQPNATVKNDFMIGHHHADSDGRYFSLVDARTQTKVDVFSRPSHIYMTQGAAYKPGRTLQVVTPEFQLAKTVYDARQVLYGGTVAVKQFTDADLLLQAGVNRIAASRALGYFEGNMGRQYILSALEEARDVTAEFPALLSRQPHRRTLSCDECIISASYPLTPLPIVYGVMAFGMLRHKVVDKRASRHARRPTTPR